MSDKRHITRKTVERDAEGHISAVFEEAVAIHDAAEVVERAAEIANLVTEAAKAVVAVKGQIADEVAELVDAARDQVRADVAEAVAQIVESAKAQDDEERDLHGNPVDARDDSPGVAVPLEDWSGDAGAHREEPDPEPLRFRPAEVIRAEREAEAAAADRALAKCLVEVTKIAQTVAGVTAVATELGGFGPALKFIRKCRTLDLPADHPFVSEPRYKALGFAASEAARVSDDRAEWGRVQGPARWRRNRRA